MHAKEHGMDALHRELRCVVGDNQRDVGLAGALTDHLHVDVNLVKDSKHLQGYT